MSIRPQTSLEILASRYRTDNPPFPLITPPTCTVPSDIGGCLATTMSVLNMFSQRHEATSQSNFNVGEVSSRSL